jgi:hypothetical protein
MRSRADLLVSASAAVFGLVSWSIAHLVTYLLFAHTHDEPTPYTHVHEGAGPILIAAIAFLATSVGASRLGSASSPVAGWAHRMQPGSLMAAAAPAAFVLVELGEHLASGDEGPPATLLIIGVVLHAAMGAVTPLLWSEFVRPAVIVLLVELSLRTDAVEHPRSVASVEPSWTAPPPLSPSSKRGPPVPGYALPSPA